MLESLRQMLISAVNLISLVKETQQILNFIRKFS